MTASVAPLTGIQQGRDIRMSLAEINAYLNKEVSRPGGRSATADEV